MWPRKGGVEKERGRGIGDKVGRRAKGKEGEEELV